MRGLGGLAERLNAPVLTIRLRSGLIAAKTNLQVMSEPKLASFSEKYTIYGGLAERLNAPVLKTGKGSRPS